VVGYIPAGWLEDDQRVFATPDEHRAAYVTYLSTRLEAPRAFAEEALHAYETSTASV
jgi:hypothetical protein